MSKTERTEWFSGSGGTVPAPEVPKVQRELKQRSKRRKRRVIKDDS